MCYTTVIGVRLGRLVGFSDMLWVVSYHLRGEGGGLGRGMRLIVVC